MSHQVRVPKLSATMEEATIVRWLKADGEWVTAGEPLVEIETDKAVMEVEALQDGFLGNIAAQEGETVAVGTVIAALAGGPGAPATAEGSVSEGPVSEGSIAEGPVSKGPVAESPVAEGSGAGVRHGDRVAASPAARRRARELNMDLSDIVGTGPGGRVLIDDVERAAEQASRPAASETPAPGPAPAATPARRPLSPLRRRIAEQVTLSHREIPVYWAERFVSMEAALEALQTVRGETEAPGAGAPRARVTVTDLLVQALADTLPSHPRLQVRIVGDAPDEWREETVGASNVGLVIAIDGGIVIAALENVREKGLRALAIQRDALVESVRQGRFPAKALAPAAVTLSNAGASGADRFQAMVDVGSAASLAVGRIHERVVPRGRSLAVERGCYLTLTVDHRAIDGLEASAFVGALADRLEAGSWKS